MKRYIQAHHIVNDDVDYTMEFENKIDVMRWLDIAEPKIRKYLKSLQTDTTYYEVDDVSWGKDCFQIPIFQGDFRKPDKYFEVDKFKFCYDPDDVYDRTAIEQLNDKLDEFLDEFSYKL